MGSGRKTFLTIALVFTLLTVFLAFYLYLIYTVPYLERREVVEVPKGLGVREVAFRLEESRVIKSKEVFILFVLLKGAENRIKAGEYEFQPGDSMARVIEKLTKGDVMVRRVTIPEGLTVDQIGGLLEANGVMSKEEFLKKAKSTEFSRRLIGNPVSSLEGYLFPDTYSYTKGITPEELIGMMVSRFKEVYLSLKERSGNPGLTDHEVVTLASIIEKETGNPSERPLISAVFHNRLKLGMRLESDPTVIYGMGDDFDGNLRKEDLRNEASGYNTYRAIGLPPGPISNPGRDSLEAALNPARVDYLYFVSKGDGTHRFSSSYRDHLDAVIRYQRQGRSH